MAYARWNDESDVYVYFDCSDVYVCSSCQEFRSNFCCATASEMVAHLLQHRQNGDLVPQYAIDNLKEDQP